MLNLNKIVKVIVLDDDILLGNMIVSFLKEERMEAVFQSSYTEQLMLFFLLNQI